MLVTKPRRTQETSMKDAKDILLEYLSSFRDPEKAANLFAEDGSFEMPYLSSLGVESRHVGRDQIKKFLSWVLSDYPDMEFKPEDVTIFIDTPGQAFAEYVTHATAAETGRKVHHLFMGRIVVEDGQIKLLREALNTLAVAQAVLPGGASDVPAPGNEVHSF
jgi:ketosteroid isomerase-like protein